jgi:hypothetical protein
MESNEHTDSSPSGSSPPPWWRAPERLIAVIGTIGLCWSGKLGAPEAAAILSLALGAPLTRGAMRVVRRLRERSQRKE